MNARAPEDRPTESELVKIAIPLLGAARDSGYDSESVWAEPLGGDRYRIWNLPVFAYNVDMRAVVRCEADPAGGLPRAVEILEPGDCLVLRLFFSSTVSADRIQEVLDLLGSRGALFEKYNERTWAVGLRTVADYEWVGPTLRPFVEEGVVEFESGWQEDQPTLGAG